MSSELTEMSETRETDKSSLPAEKQGETKQIMKLIEPPEKSAKSPPLSDTETEEEDLDEIDEILARENAPINCPGLFLLSGGSKGGSLSSFQKLNCLNNPNISIFQPKTVGASNHCLLVFTI